MSDYRDYKELKTTFHKWNEDGVPMSPETKRIYECDIKRLERGTRCRNADGSRCMKRCRECEKQRSGAHLSLDQMLEVGELPQDAFNVEELVERMDMLDALNTAIDKLSEKDRMIVVLYLQGYPERTIAKKIGACQKTVNNRLRTRIAEIRTQLKDYR